MMKATFLSVLAFGACGFANVFAHPLASGDEPADREALRQHILEEWVARQATSNFQHGDASPVQVVSAASSVPLVAAAAAAQSAAQAPATAKPFQSFSRLQLTWDKDFLHVGSNGLPDHKMMVGITAWQQQVPLPQSYFGDNAWRLPLNPVPAKTPAMIKGHFLRGAIALAVNGIPIFNPQNNRGEVSAEIGELDQWGGHCGRADDYHYHVVPLHLQTAAGKGMPVAFALDGYPIYGLTEPDGSPVGELDVCHGHELPGIGYHYHASKKYPYVIGGFHGEVVEAGGQVDPQPRAQPLRQALPPLRGAEITGFESTSANGHALHYTVGGEKCSVVYSINADGSWSFEFNNGSEGAAKEVYSPRVGGGAGNGRPRPRDPR
ncbi:MAG: YHYH protein [Roseimicrobium sp.]